MRYTAFATVLIGVVIACYAGYRYASGSTSGDVAGPSIASLLIPLAFAAALGFAGAAMWFAGKGYTESKGNLARPAREVPVLPDNNAK